MPGELKEKDAAAGTTYKIWVHLFTTGSADEIGNGSVTISAAEDVDALRKAIVDEWKNSSLKARDAGELNVKLTRDGAPLAPDTDLCEVEFECNNKGKPQVYVEVAPKLEEAPPDKRAKTQQQEWGPSMAKYTLAALPLPALETLPKFIAPPDWLAGLEAKILNEYENSEATGGFVNRTRPLCVARCSRGGKTRTLKELAHVLKKKDGIPIIFVTFNGWTTLGRYSSEQNNPLQALLVRIAFLATHDSADWESTKFETFRSNYHVSLASIRAWLGDGTPCILIIDEMNNAVKLFQDCEEGEAFGQFLRGTFLVPANRMLLFSSHTATLTTRFHSFVEASHNRRDLWVEPLPKIYSLKVAEDTFKQSFTVQKLLYHGLIPALVYTQSSPTLPAWTVDDKAPFSEDAIRNVFLSFFTGAASVHPDLLPYMDTVDCGKVLWIMSRMHMVFAGLANHLATSEMGPQLKDLCALMANFVDPKYHSGGDGFEFLFAFAFLLRAGAGYFCGPFFWTRPQPWSFSYNRYLKRETPFCDLTTWAQLKADIRRPTLEEVTFPHVAYYLPLHAQFEKYDGFACMHTSSETCTTLAFQLKCGKDTPNKDVDEPELKDNAFLVRGWPAEVQKTIQGWRFVTEDEMINFFGASGSQWLPKALDALCP